MLLLLGKKWLRLLNIVSPIKFQDSKTTYFANIQRYTML